MRWPARVPLVVAPLAGLLAAIALGSYAVGTSRAVELTAQIARLTDQVTASAVDSHGDRLARTNFVSRLSSTPPAASVLDEFQRGTAEAGVSLVGPEQPREPA